jgi:hypothetical protein
MSSSYNKYLKYKSKYIALKDEIELNGGGNKLAIIFYEDESTNPMMKFLKDIITAHKKNILDLKKLNKPQTYTIEYEKIYGIPNIYLYKFGDKMINLLFKFKVNNTYSIDYNVKKHMSKTISEFIKISRCKVEDEEIIKEIIPYTINQSGKILLNKINNLTNNNAYRIATFIIFLNVFRMYQNSSKRNDYTSIIDKIGSYVTSNDLVPPVGTNGMIKIDDNEPVNYKKNSNSIVDNTIITTIVTGNGFKFTNVNKMILIRIKSDYRSLVFTIEDLIESSGDQSNASSTGESNDDQNNSQPDGEEYNEE